MGTAFEGKQSTQYDLLDASPEDMSAADEPTTVASNGRVFVAPDRQRLYYGMESLDKYLKRAGLKAPLVVAKLFDEIDWGEFEARYASSGRAPYAPQAMMGLILYGVLQGTTSLRALERMARSDLGSQWVAGGIAPDHACIGRFIVQHEESFQAGFFDQLVRKVLKVTGSSAHTLAGDGTVVEAACSHYGLMREEALKGHVEQVKKKLSDSPDDKQCQRQAELAAQAEQSFANRKQARERKSERTDSLAVSVTDPDAMVQPQKRKRGKAASFKPSVLVNNKRVIVAYGIDPSHENTLIPGLLAQGERASGEKCDTLMLDSGYFCDSVIETALEQNINLLCPPGVASEGARKGKKYHLSEFRYDADKDAYECPAGQWLEPGSQGSKAYKTYRTAACQGCSHRQQCTSAQAGRRIRRRDSDEAKEALREVMQHPKAQQEFTQRQAMVEPVFGQLRSQQGLTRFLRRTLPGVRREFGLHVMANILGRAVVASKAFLWRLRARIAGLQTLGEWPKIKKCPEPLPLLIPSETQWMDQAA